MSTKQNLPKHLKSNLQVKCPSCSEQFSYYASETRPFCSERCQSVDTGKWLQEEFKIPGEPVYIEVKEDDDQY